MPLAAQRTPASFGHGVMKAGNDIRISPSVWAYKEIPEACVCRWLSDEGNIENRI